jgi:hypothetical protein
MSAFGVSLPVGEFEIGHFNSYSCYGGDASSDPYQEEAGTSVGSALSQGIASLSLERASDGYTGEQLSARASLNAGNAYTGNDSAYDSSQTSSLASVPYQDEILSQNSSQGSFGVRLPSHLDPLPSTAYQGSTSSVYSAYSQNSAYSDSLSTDSPAAPPNAYAPHLTPASGYEDGSYPYEMQSQEILGSTSGSLGVESARSSTSSPSALRRSGHSATSGTSSASSSHPNRSIIASGETNSNTSTTVSGSSSLNASGRNWTRDFYSVQSTISKSGANLDTVEVMDQLTKMTENFTNDAIAYGSIIIREQHLPVDQKTIKPVGVGGIAGGQKFIHEGIFFKFPTNEQNLYGNLENAMRGAGHEMKGLTGLINWELKTIGLHTIKFPLTAIIDYYGYRLVATAVLPLSSKTMVIGSGDAGRTVFDGRENLARPGASRLADLLLDWGKFLNLAPHDFRCTGFNQKIVPVSICFDLEGHIGTDGNYYLCDFARTFPPADPQGISGRFLYRLLRPEFVKKYRSKISSDSFLAMQVDKTLNVTTKEATQHLTGTWLIEAIKVWNRTINHCVPPPRILALLLHQSGINLRYLRLVSAVVLDPALKRAVNVEIMARTLKSLIRNEIRESGNLDDLHVLKIIVKWFNLALTDSNEANEYWNKELHLEMFKRFDGPDANFWTLAETLLSVPNTPSASPNPSPAPSLANSRNIPSSQNASLDASDDFRSSGFEATPSPTLTRSSGRGRGKKSSTLALDDSSPASPATAAKRTRAKKTPATSATSRSDLSSSSQKATPTRQSTRERGNVTPNHVAEAAEPLQSSGPRRSTRARVVKDPGPLPDWLGKLEDVEDQEYKTSSDSSEMEEDSSSEEDIDFPDRYAVAYGEDILSEDDEIPLKESKKRSTPKTKNRAPKLHSSSGTPSTPPMAMPSNPRSDSTGSLGSEGASRTLHSSTPTRGLLPPGVHLKRDLGIKKDDIDPEMLFVRLQELLGCYFDVSGQIKFQALLRHLKRDVKPIRLEDGTEILASPELKLTEADVARYVPRIKQMFLTPFQTAFRFKKEADETEDFDERELKLRLSWEAYLECLERNTLGDFALHNAARVLHAWLPFFPEANSNEAKCVMYLARRFSVLAEQQNKDLVSFKADVYKTSDLIEPRTGRVIAKHQPDWCHEETIKNLVLRKIELNEMVTDILHNSDPNNPQNSDIELRILLRDVYDQLFQEFAALPSNTTPASSNPQKGTKANAKATSASATTEMLVDRSVALQYWKMLARVIPPTQPALLDALIDRLLLLPKEKARLSRAHWDKAAELIF